MATPQIPLFTGTVPNRNQSPNDFADNGDDWLAYQEPLAADYNALATFVNDASLSAEVSAVNASNSESVAVAVANFKGDWSALSGALNIPASSFHNNTVWILLNDLADVTASEPSSVSVDWHQSGAVEDTTSNLTTANLVYPVGVKIVATDGTKEIKYGDGVATYNALVGTKTTIANADAGNIGKISPSTMLDLNDISVGAGFYVIIDSANAAGISRGHVINASGVGMTKAAQFAIDSFNHGVFLRTLNAGAWTESELYHTGNTVAIANGGTGASTAGTARTNLGLGVGDTPTFTGLVVQGDKVITDASSDTNTKLGIDAGDAITSGGVNNTAIGKSALNAATTADTCTAIGAQALLLNTQSNNTAVGGFSLSSNTTGSNNTAVGVSALADVTGSNNTAVGGSTGGITSGANNTLIGYNCDAGAATSQNRIVIGTNISGVANDQVSLGKTSNIVSNDFGTDAVWTRSSDIHRKRYIENSELGLSFINDLRPVTYKWKPANELPKEWDIAEDTEIDTDIVMTGMIAQEVEAALKKANIGVRFPGWSQTKTGQTISGEMYVFPLINAVQELTSRLQKVENAVQELTSRLQKKKANNND